MLRLPQMVGTVTFVALSGGYLPAAEASPKATITRPPLLVCPEPSEAGQPATPGARPNQELMASETFQRAMTDVLRLEIAVRFCELRPDTLTLDLGDGASTSASTEYNLSRLYAAYRAITEFSPETALELRNQDRLAGWYTIGGLAWTEKPAAPPAEPAMGEEERRRRPEADFISTPGSARARSTSNVATARSTARRDSRAFSRWVASSIP